jgi:hypothetical protein
VAEPSNLIYKLDATDVLRSADELRAIASADIDAQLLGKVSKNVVGRREAFDETWRGLVCGNSYRVVAAAYLIQMTDVLALATDDKTHHRYQVFAIRFLRSLLRRDVPLSPEIASFFASQIKSELPYAFGTAPSTPLIRSQESALLGNRYVCTGVPGRRRS